MKKILLCLLAVAVCSFTSCKKDNNGTDNTTQQEQTPNPAKDFEGNYTVTTLAHLQVPVIGEMDMPLSDMEAVITLKGDRGEVEVTMSGQTTTGYVNDAGMHIDPIIVNQTVASMQLAITVTFPVIQKPVDGVASWVATLTATSAMGAVTGTADMTAVKHSK
ncbi:MAG: hypothetical protein J6X58_00930 [Bacteroidales bacterium]|nr:hypothetical protein [Bacteroidales bacterium]